MKIDVKNGAELKGRWFYYRRAHGWSRAPLCVAFCQGTRMDGQLIELRGDSTIKPAYPCVPPFLSLPLILPLDELEIHGIEELAAAADPFAPKTTPTPIVTA